MLSLAFALIYGPYLFVVAHVWPAPEKAHRLADFAKRLLHRQDLALWSQLLFGLAVATACVVRRQDQGLTAYEDTTIQSVAFINFSAALITWPAIFRVVEHRCLFAALAFAQVCLTYYLAQTPSAPYWRHGAVLDRCIIPIGRVLIKARTAILAALMVLQLILFAAWLFLFWQSHWGESCHRLVRVLLFGSLLSPCYCRSCRYTKNERLLC